MELPGQQPGLGPSPASAWYATHEREGTRRVQCLRLHAPHAATSTVERGGDPPRTQAGPWAKARGGQVGDVDP
jgi:hypothetical protein